MWIRDPGGHYRSWWILEITSGVNRSWWILEILVELIDPGGDYLFWWGLQIRVDVTDPGGLRDLGGDYRF